MRLLRTDKKNKIIIRGKVNSLLILLLLILQHKSTAGMY